MSEQAEHFALSCRQRTASRCTSPKALKGPACTLRVGSGCRPLQDRKGQSEKEAPSFAVTPPTATQKAETEIM